MSKADILQQASEYIRSLEQERKRLQMQNAEMTLTLKDVRQMDSHDSVERSAVPERRKRITESCNEYVTLSSGDTKGVGEDKPEMVVMFQHERRSHGGLEAGTSRHGTHLRR